jgi:hypothetical protein
VSATLSLLRGRCLSMSRKEPTQRPRTRVEIPATALRSISWDLRIQTVFALQMFQVDRFYLGHDISKVSREL